MKDSRLALSSHAVRIMFASDFRNSISDQMQPRKHEDAEKKRNLFSCFRVFAARFCPSNATTKSRPEARSQKPRARGSRLQTPDSRRDLREKECLACYTDVQSALTQRVERPGDAERAR